ncbi:MAG TPA: glycoside hydrolase family 27 protein [Blastocatellia bacterium]|nr:glycoside hydrolase family 27 protein [Blastocatellia bacterium]
MPSCKLNLSATLISTSLVFSLLVAGAQTNALAVGNGLARTPPMGWNSWNKFACNVSEQLIKEIADAMVATGMKKAGYQYVNIDDCWQVSRDSAGNIVADPTRFPGGMKALADYVHAKGLKLGIYTDAGTMTCEKRPGSLDHELQDAKTYAAWGVDYVKIDWCHTEGLDPQKQYAKFRDALAQCGRPIVFSICNWGRNQPWTWGPATGNLWRTTGDIQDNWASVLKILDNPSQQHAEAAGPGGWNDPDMLEVGNGKMTDAEYRSHFSLWAMMAAPLIAGNDLRSMSQATKDILMNAEVIAIDQDAAGKQGTRIRVEGGSEVWAKPLKQKGAVAVVLFNRGEAAADISANWGEVGLPSGKAKVRDLWAHTDRGVFTDSFKANVPPHGVMMLKIVSTR